MLAFLISKIKYILIILFIIIIILFVYLKNIKKIIDIYEYKWQIKPLIIKKNINTNFTIDDYHIYTLNKYTYKYENDNDEILYIVIDNLNNETSFKTKIMQINNINIEFLKKEIIIKYNIEENKENDIDKIYLYKDYDIYQILFTLIHNLHQKTELIINIKDIKYDNNNFVLSCKENGKNKLIYVEII